MLTNQKTAETKAQDLNKGDRVYDSLDDKIHEVTFRGRVLKTPMGTETMSLQLDGHDLRATAPDSTRYKLIVG